MFCKRLGQVLRVMCAKYVDDTLHFGKNFALSKEIQRGSVAMVGNAIAHRSQDYILKLT